MSLSFRSVSSLDWMGLCMVLRPRQHSIDYMFVQVEYEDSPEEDITVKLPQRADTGVSESQQVVCCVTCFLPFSWLQCFSIFVSFSHTLHMLLCTCCSFFC